MSLTSKYLNRTTFSSIVLPLVHSIIQFNSVQIVSFAQSDNTGAIDVKTDGSIRWKEHPSRCWGCLSLQNCIVAFALSPLVKLPSRKLL